ncbi:juvenile hormone esterase-like isoform X2 [Planococcus citri]|uniref:juvenile hormone esterase-like isoform X2 n=1 Tax=Planococcus citri TaxID=170843 RepID=UPI0031F8523C
MYFAAKATVKLNYLRLRWLCYLVIVLNIPHLNGYISTCEPVISMDSAPVVRIPGGVSFRGSATVSYLKKRTIYQYLGIPYALPPMGPLRFKPPVPLKEYVKGTEYDNKYFKPKCPQIVTSEDDDYLQKHSDQAEDCLYLNVFTTAENGTEQKPLLPVLIYIHGGGYYQGSALEFCPNYLLDHDIVLVTVQYRLGPLGFLSFEDENVSGNMGLLDQLEAIQWVNENIKYFGGDNQRVTLSGQSSGGTSVSLMLFSPLVRPGLFQQVIIQSGNFFGEWSMDYSPKNHAIAYAKYVNCTDTDTNKLLECLISVPAYQLIRANLKYMGDRVTSKQQVVREIGINHATIQRNGSRIFLNADPQYLMKKGRFQKLPILTGFTKDEGSMIIQAFVERVFEYKFGPKLDLVTDGLIQYLKNNLFYDYIKFIGIEEDDYSQFELAEDTYIPDNTRNHFNDTVPGLVDLGGAAVMKSITLKFARYAYQYAPVYLYSFNYRGTQTKLGYGITPKHIYFHGVAHSDDLIYLFPVKNHILNHHEQKVVDHMTSLWASFVINGGKLVSTPSLDKWPIMSTYTGPYLQITEGLNVHENFLREYRNHVNDPKSSATLLKAITIYLYIFYSICFRIGERYIF